METLEILLPPILRETQALFEAGGGGNLKIQFSLHPPTRFTDRTHRCPNL